jgi:hypothetical protein
MNNFILEDYIEDLSICDDLIDFHKKSPDKKPGVVFASSDSEPKIKNFKISTDTTLIQNEVGEKYVAALQKVARRYMNKYPFSANMSRWRIMETITIQYYKPTEGFLEYHCERNGIGFPQTHRHLVFMTYLNDVDDGGETEFFHQNFKAKPKKGKTLIWPADWTHTHRGVTSLTQEKYIITGWFSYY